MTWDSCIISYVGYSFTHSPCPCNKSLSCFFSEKILRVQTPFIQSWANSLSWSLQHWTKCSNTDRQGCGFERYEYHVQRLLKITQKKKQASWPVKTRPKTLTKWFYRSKRFPKQNPYCHIRSSNKKWEASPVSSRQEVAPGIWPAKWHQHHQWSNKAPWLRLRSGQYTAFFEHFL